MSSHWPTPEEIYAKKEKRKSMLYLLIPIGSVLIGAIIAVISQSTY